ncbi:hypothetical protein FS837_011150 [Tulasnella sp. UAMH 9824]|nr:hypothetical protein FS837_011150 [Tulasnella sp. UAMH 9824]
MPYLSEALEIFRVHGQDVGAVSCLERIAEIHRQEGREADALYALEDALVIASQSGDKVGEVDVLAAQAYAFWDSGDITKAVATLRTASDTARQIGYLFGVQEGSYEEAEKICQESISLARSINYGLLLARSFAELGRTLRRLERVSEAVSALQNAYYAFQDIAFSGTGGAEAAESLAEVKEEQGDVQATLFWLEQAIAEYRRLGKMEQLSAVLEHRGRVLFDVQQYCEAAVAFEASWILSYEIELFWRTRRVVFRLARIPKTATQAGL